MPGVLKVEPVRSTDVIFTAGSRSRRNALQGVPANVSLNRTAGREPASGHFPARMV